MQIKLSMINWLNCIWESDLPSNSKYLAAYLRKFMNDNQDMAWPSYSRISKETGLARPTISKYLAILDSKGWLKREKGNCEKNTVYYAVFPKQIEQQLALVNSEGSKGDLLGVVNDINYGSKGDLLGVVNEVNSNKQVNKQSNKQNIVSNETKLVEKAFGFIWQETLKLKKEFPNGGMGSKKYAKIAFKKLFGKDYFKKRTEEEFKAEVNELFALITKEFELSLANLNKGSNFTPFERKALTSILNAEEWRN